MTLHERVYWHDSFPLYVRETFGRGGCKVDKLADQIAADLGTTRATVHVVGALFASKTLNFNTERSK